MSTLWYFGLAPQKSRYTEQLSQRWMPRAFRYVFSKSPNKWCDVESTTGKDLTEGLNDDVRTGVVLDDYSRVVHCYRQCENFAKLISLGEVENGDAIFLQDYWTPGIEGILYSLSVRGISVRLYAMCHAQSVDVYDFTSAMKYWIRNAELSIDRYIKKNGGAIFVASSVHRQQLRDADFLAPIHVMGLPFDYYDVRPNSAALSSGQREKKVVFASRMHPEKQPEFMLNVAEQVLSDQEVRWVITTSAQDLQTSTESAQYIKERIDDIRERKGDRLEVKTGLSKEEYYQELLTSKVIFNCSLQDYVSWTLLEGITHGCIPVYPDFRSFPECLPEEFLYGHYDVDVSIRGEEFSSTFEAVCHINDFLSGEGSFPLPPYDTVLRCNAGRLLEASVIDWELTNQRDMQKEQNVWDLPIDVIHLLGKTHGRK